MGEREGRGGRGGAKAKSRRNWAGVWSQAGFCGPKGAPLPLGENRTGRPPPAASEPRPPGSPGTRGTVGAGPGTNAGSGSAGRWQAARALNRKCAACGATVPLHAAHAAPGWSPCTLCLKVSGLWTRQELILIHLVLQCLCLGPTPGNTHPQPDHATIEASVLSGSGDRTRSAQRSRPAAWGPPFLSRAACGGVRAGFSPRLGSFQIHQRLDSQP